MLSVRTTPCQGGGGFSTKYPQFKECKQIEFVGATYLKIIK